MKDLTNISCAWCWRGRLQVKKKWPKVTQYECDRKCGFTTKLTKGEFDQYEAEHSDKPLANAPQEIEQNLDLGLQSLNN